MHLVFRNLGYFGFHFCLHSDIPTAKLHQIDMSAAVASGKRIIIVGAGIAGLSFALSLRKQWPHDSPPPNITIYERESKDTVGREGYSLSIRSDALSGGIQVLQNLDLLDRLHPFSTSATSSRPGSFNLWTTDWENLLKISNSDESNQPSGMRIARSVLRRVLIDAVSTSDQIIWDRPCSRIEEADGKTRVHFSTGDPDECDILVVADGASSRIRTQLRPTDTLEFTGVVCISGTSSFPEHRIPYPVDADWGGVLGGGGVGLFVSPIDSSKALWSLSYYSDEPRERLNFPLSGDKIEGILHEAVERGQHFQQPFQDLVVATDPSTLMVLNAMDKQPFPHSGAVVFIGDANHAVSPFAGNGANMALLDGWDLAEQLSKAGSMATALEWYDQNSMPRSATTVNHSRWAISMFHATGLKMWAYRGLLGLVRTYMRWIGTSCKSS